MSFKPVEFERFRNRKQDSSIAEINKLAPTTGVASVE